MEGAKLGNNSFGNDSLQFEKYFSDTKMPLLQCSTAKIECKGTTLPQTIAESPCCSFLTEDEACSVLEQSSSSRKDRR